MLTPEESSVLLRNPESPFRISRETRLSLLELDKCCPDFIRSLASDGRTRPRRVAGPLIFSSQTGLLGAPLFALFEGRVPRAPTARDCASYIHGRLFYFSAKKETPGFSTSLLARN